MRKRVIEGLPEVPHADHGWLDLERLAQVEITSEDDAYPIESALVPGVRTGGSARFISTDSPLMRYYSNRV